MGAHPAVEEPREDSPIDRADRALAREPAAQHLPAPPADYSYEWILPLQGGQNFLDMGGYPASQHRHVRWGLLFRSSSVYALSPADFDYLRKLGIRIHRRKVPADVH